MTWRAGSFLRQGRNEAAESSVTLRLKSKKKVNWGTDVVDNEDMGKRKSNKCCIFHKRKKFGESSSESEYSDSGDESSMRSGGGGARRPPRRRPDKCDCDIGGSGSDAGMQGNGSGRNGDGVQRRGPFSQRVQDQERPNQSSQFSLHFASGAARGPLPGLASAPGWEWVDETGRSADLRLDSRAVGQLQAENRAP